jgi:hypothetical protein
MNRWIVFALLTGCMAAQDSGMPAQNKNVRAMQAPQDQGESPTPPPNSMPPAPSPAITPATDGFPFDKFPEFSAIMVGSVLTGDEREAHIYRSDDLLRMQGTEGLGYFLTDLKSLETYGLTRLGCMSDPHLYFRAFPFSAVRPGRKVERVAEGKESVDGHMCQVETVTVSSGDLAMPIKLKFWEADDMQGFPVKVQILNRVGQGTIHYKDVVIGPVDPTLFVRPQHCVAGLPQPPKKRGKGAKTKQAAPTAGKSQQ